MTQEALKLALEYLESRGLAWNVQIALREALRENAMREVQRLGQEIEQEPVCPDCKAKVLYECVACSSNNYPPKTEQEPVMWVSEDVCEGQLINGRPRKIWWECDKGVGTAFYTHPPQRTWVGLTDEEENEYNYLGPDMHWVIQEIAAKLKEKNT